MFGKKEKKQPEIIVRRLPEFSGSGISLIFFFELIDTKSGVKYLATSFGSSSGYTTTPRLDTDGKPMIATPEEIKDIIERE